VHVNRATAGSVCCLLVAATVSCALRPPFTGATTLHALPDSVQLVTTDIPRFWKAFDDAAGKDSATRVHIFADEYLTGGSVGLQDFARIKLKGRSKDSTVTATEELAHATAEWPRLYAGIRTSSMKVASTDTVLTVVRKGLRALAELYPEGRYPDVYFVIGRLNSAGTASSRGMLIGTAMSSRTSTTPVDEIPAWVQEFTVWPGTRGGRLA
jgi:hypothetical protein